MAVEIDLEGRVAVVTGGGRGIGRAIATELVRAGAACVIASRKEEVLAQTAAELGKLGGTVLPCRCHVGNEEDRRHLVETAERQLGPVDILVNNAATNVQLGSAVTTTPQQFSKMFEVNVHGPLRLCQLVADSMRRRRRGSIINVTSVSGLVPQRQSALYSASKAALIMLTRSLAEELGADGVRVNAIAPGLTRTDLSRYLWEDARRREQYVGQQMLPGLAEPGEIAPTALFLASDLSAFVTGEVVVVDGGMTSRGSARNGR